MERWRIEDSAELYNINEWGVGYFSINRHGHMSVRPRMDGHGIDLFDLVKQLQSDDVSTPMLLRFPDILDNRIENMDLCFRTAASKYGYGGKNIIVYPVKVNQMEPVVQEIVNHGRKYRIGLEAGSKPELHAVIATSPESDSVIICNGYKDEDYIELAFLAQKMGRRIFLVVEKLNELKRILQLAKRLDLKPNLGIRIKLATSGSGKWAESGGDQSKFGLTSDELISACELLSKAGMQSCLRMIHFHIGSQVNRIRTIKVALREASQFFAQLHRMRFNIEFVDIGGGLGIDYDGTRSASSESSVNYSMQEYYNDVVYSFADVCHKNDIDCPTLITESGRALTAHHSVLIVQVLEKAGHANRHKEGLVDDDHSLAHEMQLLLDRLSHNNMLESWHDALQIREEALDLFSLGMLDLGTRAKIEQFFWAIAHDIYQMTFDLKRMPEDLQQLPKLLAEKYFCNFSLFQSLPDSWAVDQVFPIVPIHRLQEKPAIMATLQDITCDSDGKIDHFIATNNHKHAMPVHRLKDSEPYYLGVFLVGAYQEILGDLHNLFGDTNAVHISVGNDGYNIDKVIDGESVAEVLEYAQYNPKKLVRTVETWVNSSVKKGLITAVEGREFLSNYRSGLYGYTYLE